MRVIKLMADYDCFPLWEASPGIVGNINPDGLPLSPELRQKLSEWARIFDATLDRDDPAQSGFVDGDASAHFNDMMLELQRQIQSELGPNFLVTLKQIA